MSDAIKSADDESIEFARRVCPGLVAAIETRARAAALKEAADLIRRFATNAMPTWVRDVIAAEVEAMAAPLPNVVIESTAPQQPASREAEPTEEVAGEIIDIVDHCGAWSANYCSTQRRREAVRAIWEAARRPR